MIWYNELSKRKVMNLKRKCLIICAVCAFLCSCSLLPETSSRSEVTAAPEQTTVSATETTATTTTAETTTTAVEVDDDNWFSDEDIFVDPTEVTGGHEIIGEVDGNSYAKFTGTFTVGGKPSPLADVIIQRENYTYTGSAVEAQYYLPYNRLYDLGATYIYKDGSVINFGYNGYDISITDGELVVHDTQTDTKDFGLCGNIELDGVFYVGFQNLVPLFGGRVKQYSDPDCPEILWSNFEL